MAPQDIEGGLGCAVIDPHGDLVERIAARTSRSGRADVIYFNAADPLQPYGYAHQGRHLHERNLLDCSIGKSLGCFGSPGKN
jgi:hypothetical protein